MSLRILFADDSMTAQNMGKKILSEAGYDVVAVSNGAAAVKKIAEQKPDIIILDVYMPGYSGLEVCEKVRGSLETLKTPVLLTVGKMEPYKPEDANRVKADGVIIKPFEASDLLAIVKKFEERIGSAPPPPMAEQTVLLDRQYAEEAIAAPEPPIEHHSTGKTGMQPMVEVPDHMASSAAFGDMLGVEPPNTTTHFAVNTAASAFETSVIVPAPPVPASDFEMPVSWKVEPQQEPEPVAAPVATVPKPVAPPEQVAPAPVAPPVQVEPEAEVMAVPVEPEPAYVPEAVAPQAEPESFELETEPEHPVMEEPEVRHPHFIPVYREPEPSPSYEVMPTSAPPLPDLQIPREPALQETAEEATRSTIASRVEPGLMSTIEQQVQGFREERSSASEPAVDVSPAHVEATASPEAAPSHVETPAAPAPAAEITTPVGDADFEARVAAALAAYGHATESAPPPHVVEVPGEPAHIAESSPESSHVDVETHPMAKATPVEAAPLPAEPIEYHPVHYQPPSFEYRSPVRAPEPQPEIPPESMMQAEPAAVVQPPAEKASTAETVAIPETTYPEAIPTPVTGPSAVHDMVAASVEAALPAGAATASETASGADHQTIAQAVHRVMERLKPELVEEIMRELKTKK